MQLASTVRGKCRFYPSIHSFFHFIHPPSCLQRSEEATSVAQGMRRQPTANPQSSCVARISGGLVEPRCTMRPPRHYLKDISQKLRSGFLKEAVRAPSVACHCLHLR